MDKAYTDLSMPELVRLNRALVVQGNRVCPVCRKLLEIDDFPKLNGRAEGACYECRAERQVKKYHNGKKKAGTLPKRSAWIRRAPGKEEKTFSMATVRIENTGLVVHTRCGGTVTKLPRDTDEGESELIEAFCQKCSERIYLHINVLESMRKKKEPMR